MEEDIIMAPNLLFYQLLLIALELSCFLLPVWWLDNTPVVSQMSRKPAMPRRKRSKEPKPFPGLLYKPLCEACEQGADERPQAPASPPPLIPCGTIRAHRLAKRSRSGGGDAARFPGGS